MMLDPQSVSSILTGTVGLPFAVTMPTATTIELQLADGNDERATFAILAALIGRQLQVTFRAGRWAGELVSAMGQTDEEGQRIWVDLVSRCTVGEGARLTMTVNGQPVDARQPASWPSHWQLLTVVLERPRVALDDYDATKMGLTTPEIWIARFGAAIAALLPIEELEVGQFEPDIEGDPRLAAHFRYERSRRNRAAALSIHGYGCFACSTNMEAVYGPLGADFIHVHHENMLADQGGAHQVDPYTDLVPLCPNCHAIAHRRRPPYSVQEIREALAAVPSSNRQVPNVG